MTVLKKIVVIGPESTGKSTLCEQLAGYFKTYWCREYARAYLLQHGTNYTFEDLLTIAKGQAELEEKAIATAIAGKKEILFIDTDMYVMKVWCEFVFDKCHTWILDQVVSRQYDHYLLCNTDLPWVKDELREYPDLISRQKLYNIYKDIMINQHTPWTDISGNYQERFEKARVAVEELFGIGSL
ncbi:MAG: AAA family ATPase [Chitinophagaceae bacterium]|nr:AAA family ATPase [Chitinophagaceae bacterium]